MALHKTEGIVLRRRDLGEADRILTLFTRKFGKLRAVAKGCRRPRSRLAGHVEPLNVADLLLWRREGRELAIVSGAELTRRHPRLAADMQVFAAAQAAAEFLDGSLEDDEPQPRLYQSTLTLLKALQQPEHAAQALLAFLVRASEWLGYAMSVDRCAACRGRLDGAEAPWLDYAFAGLVCTACTEEEPRRGERAPVELVRALKAAAAHPPRVAPARAAAAAVNAVDRLLCFHQDRRPLNAGRLLDRMAQG